MDDQITIRKATLSDLTDILDIESRCFDADRFSKRQFTYLLTHTIFQLAISHQKLFGYYILLRTSRSKKTRLYSIAVHPDARGRNIGHVLMEDVIQKATALHSNCITLEVRENNTQAIHLYKKNGFIEQGIKANYYADGANALIMHKYLINP